MIKSPQQLYDELEQENKPITQQIEELKEKRGYATSREARDEIMKDY